MTLTNSLVICQAVENAFSMIHYTTSVDAAYCVTYLGIPTQTSIVTVSATTTIPVTETDIVPTTTTRYIAWINLAEI